MRIVNLDKLTYAGNLDTLAAVMDHPRHVFVQGDIGDRELVAQLLRDHRVDAVVNFAAESHVDRSIDGPAEFIETNVSAPSTCSTAPGLTGPRSTTPARPRSASCTSPPTRSTARSATPAPSPRRPPTPQFALLGLQGRVRPSGAGLAPHLRPAGADHQLLQQLRPLPVSGKADPADDLNAPRRQAAADLRRRLQRARLALRRGSLPRHRPRVGARAAPARSTTSAATARRPTWRSSTPSAHCSTRRCPIRRIARTPNSSSSSPTAPATTGATPSTPPRSSKNSAGSRPRPSRAVMQRTVHWYLDQSRVVARVTDGSYHGQRLGSDEATGPRAGPTAGGGA